MRIQREVTVYYEVDVSRTEAIDMLREHDPEAKGLEDLSGADLKALLVATANDDDALAWTLDDLAYEIVDSVTGPWMSG